MFINTTPQTIGIRCHDGNVFFVEQTKDKRFVDLFRCTSTAAPADPLDLSAQGSVTVTAPPVYMFDIGLFRDLMDGEEFREPTYFLISTIAAEAWKQSGLVAPRNCRIFVPYSGPDTTKCHREKGVPVWTAELMDYT